jgi:Uma2 family endonuclease
MMIRLNIQPLQLTNQQFFDLCQVNRDVRLERTAQGDMIVMTPAGSETGKQNLSIGSQLWNWNEQTTLGVAFDSSTGFILPNGATRSPDAAWIPQARWDALSADEQEHFLPFCPDFVIELRSPSDALPPLREKMREYMAHGARLGWLIDPQTRQVEVYRQGREVETLDKPARVAGEDVLPGFVLNMQKVWDSCAEHTSSMTA